jgi:PilZ domain
MTDSGTRLDARQNPRFNIAAPILFSWHEGGSVHDESGVTQNLSIKGMFVSSSECPPPDSIVDFELQLPRFGPQKTALTIKAQARVTRVEFSLGSSPAGFSFCGGPWGIFDTERGRESAVDGI